MHRNYLGSVKKCDPTKEPEPLALRKRKGARNNFGKLFGRFMRLNWASSTFRLEAKKLQLAKDSDIN